MRISLMIAMLLSGVIMAILGGCYGNSPMLNPVISFTMPKEPAEGAVTYVPVVSPGDYLVFKGTVDIMEKDVIKRQLWTQQTNMVGGVLGNFFVTDTMETSWEAPPQWAGPGDLPITLTFTVDTVMGGHTEKKFYVLVRPPL